MDPIATLKELVSAFMNGDVKDATDSAYALINWLDSGGFIPHRVKIALALEEILEQEK